MREAGKFAGSGDGNDAAGVQENNAIGEQEGFANVVGDQHDSFCHVGGQAEDLALEFGAGDRVEGAEGFVHEKNLRISSESPGHTDALALAAGQLSRIAVRIDRRG